MQSGIPKPLISHRNGNVPISSVNECKIFQSVLIPPDPQITRQLGLCLVPFEFAIPGLDFASLFVDRGRKKNIRRQSWSTVFLRAEMKSHLESLSNLLCGMSLGEELNCFIHSVDALTCNHEMPYPIHNQTGKSGPRIGRNSALIDPSWPK